MRVCGCLQRIRWEGCLKINLSVKSHFQLVLKFCLILVFARETVRACRAGRRVPAPLSDESLQFNKLQRGRERAAKEKAGDIICLRGQSVHSASATSWLTKLENVLLSENPKSFHRDRKIQFDLINGPVAERCCKPSKGCICLSVQAVCLFTAFSTDVGLLAVLTCFSGFSVSLLT